MTYDALDRILTRTYPADSTLNVAFTYDQSGHGSGIGHLTSDTDQSGSLSLTYDQRGNVTSNARTISSTVYTTGLSYDSANRVQSITYPTGGWIAAYARDSAGQVTSVTATQPGHSAVNIATSITHMPFGLFKSLTWGNGVTDSRSFDLDYRMTNIVDSTPSALQNLTYAYDADNNLKTITDAVTAANSQTLTYSSANWLTGAVSGTGGYGTLSYTYDNNGNRKTDGATTYTYTTGTNRISAVGSNSLTYNSAGNITAIGTTQSMTYNKANQLASATVSGTTSSYVYDGFGQRLKVTVGAGTPSVTQYLPNGDNQILTETNSGVETDYLYLDGIPVSVIQPAAATISYIHPDHLGTPQIATNSSKTTVWQGRYQPFGAVTPTSSITMNLRFPGQQADVTGYNHNGFRDYNPATGRYLETDPIGLWGGINPYLYTDNNPMTFTDVLGLDTWIINRVLGGGGAEPRWDPITHTFVAITNPDGTVAHTFSWGNSANTHGWNLDQPEDIGAATQALLSKWAEWVGNDDLDIYIPKAFNNLNQPFFEHPNGWIKNNCKTEAQNLLNNARTLHHADAVNFGNVIAKALPNPATFPY